MPNLTPLNPDALAHARSAAFDCWESGGNMDDLAACAIEAYLAVAQPVVRGYIIVDKKTGKIDFDGELHTSIESAIQSMIGPYQGMCRTAGQEDDAANEGKTAWWRIYSIHIVTDRPAVNDA